MTKLTPKQARFCAEYLIDLNGTQAAIRAGYSARTANEQAAQLLAKLSIQARIAELIADKIGHENQAKPDIQSKIAGKQRTIGHRRTLENPIFKPELQN